MPQGHTMQPAKHIPIPAGATHFSPAHAYPFEQWTLDGQRYVFITDEWELMEPHPRYGYRNGANPLQELEVPQDAPIVTTPHGVGRLLGTQGKQWLVDLEVNPFKFRPAAFQGKEISTVHQSQNPHARR